MHAHKSMRIDMQNESMLNIGLSGTGLLTGRSTGCTDYYPASGAARVDHARNDWLACSCRRCHSPVSLIIIVVASISILEDNHEELVSFEGEIVCVSAFVVVSVSLMQSKQSTTTTMYSYADWHVDAQPIDQWCSH